MHGFTMKEEGTWGKPRRMKRIMAALSSLTVTAAVWAMGMPSAMADQPYGWYVLEENLKHPITISNVRVTNVTGSSADIVMDYTFDRQGFKKTTGVDTSYIKNIGFVANVQKITSMTPAETYYEWGWAGCSPMWTDSDDLCTNVTSDEEITDDKVQEMYGLQTSPLKVGDHIIGTVSGYDFHRVYTLVPSELKDKGSVTITLKGLQPGTWYGNKNLPKTDREIYPMALGDTAKWALLVEKMKEAGQPGTLIESPYECTENGDSSVCTGGETYGKNKNHGTPINVDMNQLFVGTHIDVDVQRMCGDANTFSVYQDAVQIPPFTTAAADSTEKVAFTDVNSGTPHYEDISWLAANKISEGYKNTNGTYRFEGMTPVYRQDMAAFLRRLAVKNNIGDAADWTPSDADWKKFKDVDKNTPHVEDILWLAHAGISEGWKEKDGSYTFRGMNTVVRQDMAAFLHRLASKAGNGTDVTPVNNFKDVDSGTPHVDDIRWLAGAKITEGWKESDGRYTFRGMSSVVRQDMAAFLHRTDTLLAD